jgi:IMP dehydrogenase
MPREKSCFWSRKDVDPSTDFLGIKLSLPIISSPMITVTGHKMAIELRELGGLGTLPRTDNIKNDLNEYNLVKEKNKEVIVAIPATNDYMERIDFCFKRGCKHFCLDLANGFSTTTEHAIKKIRFEYGKDVFIITGNVGSVEGYEFLNNLGIDGVRVSIGAGAACSTSLATGIACGQFSLLREIAEYKEKNNCKSLIIADGGLKNSGDIAKCIAIGSDICMLGKVFAACKESPGNIIKDNGILFKQYAGQSSIYVKKSNDNIEGIDSLIKYQGTIKSVWTKLEQGLRSSMSYMNCRTLDEFKYLSDNCFTLTKVDKNFSIE